MSHDEIMAMAREAGFRTGQINLSNGSPVPFITPASGTNCTVELERFAALVAAKEREACAQVAMEFRRGAGDPVCGEVAAAIRERNSHVA